MTFHPATYLLCYMERDHAGIKTAFTEFSFGEALAKWALLNWQPILSEDQEIVQSNLNAARRHLVWALANQGEDVDAEAEAKAAEAGYRSRNPSHSDETVTQYLVGFAFPYEDM